MQMEVACGDRADAPPVDHQIFRVGSIARAVEAGRAVAGRSNHPSEEVSLAIEGEADGSLVFFAMSFNSIGQDYKTLCLDELVELQVKVKRLGYAQKQGVSWAKIAEPFRREVAELIGFGDYFEDWLEIYGR